MKFSKRESKIDANKNVANYMQLSDYSKTFFFYHCWPQKAILIINDIFFFFYCWYCYFFIYTNSFKNIYNGHELSIKQIPIFDYIWVYISIFKYHSCIKRSQNKHRRILSCFNLIFNSYAFFTCRCDNMYKTS